MAAFFSLTAPVGIGIGMGVSNVYRENSQSPDSAGDIKLCICWNIDLHGTC
ncbi:hypothetical protein QQ045_031910 [Rhodiola kirilowii]